MLGLDASGALRDQLVAELKGIGSAEEAATWAHRVLSAKGTLVAADDRSAVLSVITGGGKWVEITTHADPLYQHLIVTAERKFWRCVESGEPPALFGIDPPRPRIEAVRTRRYEHLQCLGGICRRLHPHAGRTLRA